MPKRMIALKVINVEFSPGNTIFELYGSQIGGYSGFGSSLGGLDMLELSLLFDPYPAI